MAQRSIPAWAGQPVDGPEHGHHCWVYPRVGGATPVVNRREPRIAGLSPRGRGNRSRNLPRYTNYGSIPAWAGQPPVQACAIQASLERVYPRVGGATSSTASFPAVSPWSWVYPRVGGATHLPRSLQAVQQRKRSIPAWAGQPSS